MNRLLSSTSPLFSILVSDPIKNRIEIDRNSALVRNELKQEVDSFLKIISNNYLKINSFPLNCEVSNKNKI